MSKQVVSPDCVKNIASFLARDERFDHVRRALAAEGVDLDASNAALSAFATRLAWINEQDYVNAYAHHGEKFQARMVRFEHGPWNPGDLEAFKALQSWLYQLDDPDESLDPVVRIVNQAARDLAEMIIAELPGYDGLPWG